MLDKRLAAGGFGTVWTAQDRTLHQTVVIKLVEFPDAAARDAYLAATPVEAVLRHDGIVPILDQGHEGLLVWMVMKHVAGSTFEALIATLHGSGTTGVEPTVSLPDRESTVSSAGVSRVDPSETPEGQLAAIEAALELLVRASRAIGFAHANGTVHRDIKPDNLMFEEHAGSRTPRVIDWGLARTLPRPGTADTVDEPPSLHAMTRSVGVPNYLAPERLLDGAGRDERTVDVYALGAVLHRLLGGRGPRPGIGLEEARRLVAADPRVSLPDVPLIVSRAPEWLRVCACALDPQPALRPRDADAFADALELAMLRVRLRRNRAHRDDARRLEGEAVDLRVAARRALATVCPWEGVEPRREAWALEEAAERHADEALDMLATWRRGVDAVLRERPRLPEAHIELAEHHARTLRRAERTGDRAAIRRHRLALIEACDAVDDGLEHLRRSCPIDPSADPEVPERLRAHRELLAGSARVTLRTAPSGVAVAWAAYREIERVLTLAQPSSLGTTPIEGREIERVSSRSTDAEPAPTPMRVAPGRAALLIEAADTRVVYPIHAFLGEHWDGIPPGGDAPAPVPLPPAGALRRSECYVPAGWAWIGGDPHAIDPIERRRVWIGGFVMARQPVTHGAYIAFLNDLVDRGRGAEARQHAPRQMSTDDQERLFEYGQGTDGRYHFLDVDPNAPVCLISWDSARAFTAWYASRDGRPWRLPSEWEYEKAARGVDGRRLPWGDHMEAFRSRLINAIPGPAAPVAVDADTDDVSPYGIRWLAGNMRTWCLERWDQEPPTHGERAAIPPDASDELAGLRIMRGGSWGSAARATSAANRFADPPSSRLVTCGIRLVYGCDAGWDPNTGLPRPTRD